jgi:hypothetical protein
MKKLFTNYNFDFSKNEKKLITTFCRQVLKQLDSDQHFSEIKAFNSIIEKMNSGTEGVKLTKDELMKLTNNLKQNIDYIKKQMERSWFLKKWLLNSLHKQYLNLYETHLKG